MNKFEKISYAQYIADAPNGMELVEYKDVKLPKRATKGSAGYDFFSTCGFTLKPGDEIKIPTGIRVLLDPDKFLAIYPRSGLGFKYQLHLANTVGIIDADYSSSDNEGHMWIKLVNGGNKELTILPGEAIAQGIIQTFCLTDDDNTDGIRNGGFGSTSK